MLRRQAASVRSSAARLRSVLSTTAILLAAGVIPIQAAPPDKLYAIREPYLFRENVGLLDLMVTNLGVFGNPGFVDGYGAEWRNAELLYAGGIWIGAVVDGIPHVSTALYEYELRPSLLPIDTIYPSYEGAPGGNRLGTSTHPDDDGDGLIDEDFLNGKDDDGDGRIDEDYAAVSDQMLSCEYWDYTPEAQQQYPAHRPLNVLVRQRTFGWGRDPIDEFVGMEYRIENVGVETLRDVYFGFFIDGDIGPKDHPSYYGDDGCGIVDVDGMPMAYMFDFPDGYLGANGGDTEGFFGALLLGHTIDRSGTAAPVRLGLHTARFLRGSFSYPAGDPADDFQRYDLLQSGDIEQAPSDVPDDYRLAISTDRFPEFAPGAVATIRIAFVAGDGYFEPGSGPHPELGGDGQPSEDCLLANARRAQEVYRGCAGPDCAALDEWLPWEYPGRPGLTADVRHGSVAKSGIQGASGTGRERLRILPIGSPAAVPVRFSAVLSEPGSCSFTILDPAGRIVRVLESGVLPAGRTDLMWDGRDAAGAQTGSGFYFVRGRTAGAEDCARVVILRR